MGFMSRKSVVDMEEKESQQRRNRLSKPLTNKSNSNLRWTASQQPSGQTTPHASTSELSLHDVPQGMPIIDSRVHVRAHSLVVVEDDVRSCKNTTTTHTKGGVAQLVAQFEKVPSDTHPLHMSSQSSVKTTRPTSDMINTPVSASAQEALSAVLGSRDMLRTKSISYRDRATESPEPFVDLDRIRSRRRSHYLPGQVTRKPVQAQSQASIQDKMQHDKPASEQRTPEQPHEARPLSGYQKRSETPKSFTALGNWSIGSLHIVNGRASPSVVGELPRHFAPRPPMKNRDVSSEYGSENWEDETVPDDTGDYMLEARHTSTNTELEHSSHMQQDEDDHVPTRGYTTPEPTMVQPLSTPRRTPDRASTLAQAYMAELPPSPFATHESSPSTGSVIHHAFAEATCDLTDRNDNDSQKEGPGSTEQRRCASTESDPSTIVSKLSSVDTQFKREEVFQSALEFQDSSSSEHELSERLQPTPTTTTSATVDSGYGSAASLRTMGLTSQGRESVQLEDSREAQSMPSTPSEVAQQAQGAAVSKPVVKENHKQGSPRKLGGFLPLRPPLKSRATAPAAPTSSEMRVTTKATNVATPTTKPANAEKPSRLRKKLQKSRRNSLVESCQSPNDIVVQRVQSIECLDVPAISSAAAANLDSRVKIMPELECTVQTRPQSYALSNVSSLSIPTGEIRFPSPLPEQPEEERSRKRSKSKPRARSKSRRRSFIEFFTGDKDADKRKSAADRFDQEITLDDLGDVVAALGTNPYDIATKKPGSRGPDLPTRTAILPHEVSSHRARPRSMMNDETAAEYSRILSRSMNEREQVHGRRSSFDDRGGIPGKSLRPDRTAADIPPLPPVPTGEELRRISWRQSRQSSTFTRTPRSDRVSWNGQTSSPVRTPQSDRRTWVEPCSPYDQDSPAPVPPPHSPRPSFVHDDEYDQVDEDLSLPPPPPPPSHSPRPVDVDPEYVSQNQDMWAAHAQAWRARRQSAGEALRARWMNETGDYDDQSWHDHDQQAYGDASLYPDIPDRHEDRGRYGVEDRQDQWPLYDESNGYHEHDQRGHQRNEWNGDAHYAANADLQHLHYSEASYDQAHYDVGDYDDRRVEDYHVLPYSDDRSHASTRSRSRPTSQMSRHSRVSGVSAHSFATSLAEELQPADRERKHPAPEFGRYSGGLGYGYEGRDKGFGGSAGTRSVSGKAEGTFKGTDLRGSWGVDLGDVPVIGVVTKM